MSILLVIPAISIAGFVWFVWRDAIVAWAERTPEEWIAPPVDPRRQALTSQEGRKQFSTALEEHNARKNGAS